MSSNKQNHFSSYQRKVNSYFFETGANDQISLLDKNYVLNLREDGYHDLILNTFLEELKERDKLNIFSQTFC